MKRTAISVLVLSMVALTGCKSINLSTPVSSKDTSLVVPPVVEKRETITATGYAVVTVQNHKNPAQQRLMAIRASKDTFRTKVEGVIYGARLVSITPVGEDTYETTLSLDRDVVQDLRIMYLGQVAAKGR
jgi:hypothetical protein